MRYSLSLSASWKNLIRMPFKKRKQTDGPISLKLQKREVIEKIIKIWYNYKY